jgi:hypothetical protein
VYHDGIDFLREELKLFKAKHVRELNYLGNTKLHTVEPLSITFEGTALKKIRNKIVVGEH